MVKEEKPSVLNLELNDIEGIGDTLASKMKKAGILSITQLAVMASDQLIELIDCSKEAARLHIENARELLRETGAIGNEFETAEESLEKRKKILRLSTGSSVLDEMLKGGIESQAMTEFYGEFGSGKTQICFTTSVLAVQKEENGGINKDVIYLDTEGTFRSERVEEIAKARGFDVIETLKRIHKSKVYTSDHLENIVNELPKFIENYNAGLIIIDSIMSLHRAEFIGRGTLSDRQQRVNNMLHKLVRMAEIYNVLILVSNQVQADPAQMFGDPIKPVGGNALGHTSTYRFYVKKSGHNRICSAIDSPYHPYGAVKFTVTERGVTDIEEEVKKK